MDEARGVAACGGGQLVTRMGDLPEQVHGFGVGGSSRREWYNRETIACGSHGFAVLALLGCCFLSNLGGVSSGKHIKRGASMQHGGCDTSGFRVLDDSIYCQVLWQLV